LENLLQADSKQISVSDFSPIRIRLIWLILTISALVYYIYGCASSTPPVPERPPDHPKPYKVFGKWYQPLPDSKGFRQRGIASWYGKNFHGKKPPTVRSTICMP
jgi:rare lipoprotein A